MLSSQGTME